MNENDALETSVVPEEEAPAAAEPAEEASPVWATEAEVEALRADYPDFDPEAALAHPVLGALLRGEGRPSLRQLYEAVHFEDIVAGRIEAAVSEAVTRAVTESEERLLETIRARGQRPVENGISAAAGIRMHPAVSRLTRRERAMLARRAENGETIKL